MKNKSILTQREEEIMRLFWQYGPMLRRDVCIRMKKSDLHINTIATFLHNLEDKGFIDHEAFGHTYRYHAVVSKVDYGRSTLQSALSRYFNNSLRGAVCALVGDDRLSDNEARELIEFIKNKSAR